MHATMRSVGAVERVEARCYSCNTEPKLASKIPIAIVYAGSLMATFESHIGNPSRCSDRRYPLVVLHLPPVPIVASAPKFLISGTRSLLSLVIRYAHQATHSPPGSSSPFAEGEMQN